jgi:flagellar basal body-associated protein FliL
MARSAENKEELNEVMPVKSGSKVGLILLLNVVLIGGFLVYLFAFNRPAASSQAPAPAAQGADPGPLVSLDNFIVNLADLDANRYLKVGLTFELNVPEASEAFRKREPLVKDAIIQLASNMTFKQVRTQQGKEALRTSLLARLEAVLGSKMVSNIYYTEFVVQ